MQTVAQCKVRGCEFKNVLCIKNPSACTEPAHTPMDHEKCVSEKASDSNDMQQAFRLTRDSLLCPSH